MSKKVTFCAHWFGINYTVYQGYSNPKNTCHLLSVFSSVFSEQSRAELDQIKVTLCTDYQGFVFVQMNWSFSCMCMCVCLCVCVWGGGLSGWLNN